MSEHFSVIAKNGMVASSRPLATLAGVRVLLNGGNAVDAAVATAAVLGVVEPMSIGIGGDAFCLLYCAGDRSIKALDASGRSPQSATREFFRQSGFRQMPQRGIHSVTVPGAVGGWAELVAAHGSKRLAELLEPAIIYAEYGFPVAEATAESWRESEARLNSDEGACAVYLIDGRAPKAGEIFRNPRMARALGQIAQHGPGAFYQGDIAEKIVRCAKKHNGLLTLEDFARHGCDWVEPITVGYRGFDVYELPPATQGFVALEMLKILEGFDLRAMGAGSPDALHVMIEAKKLAFADRDRYLADRDFMAISAAELISGERARRLRERIRIGETGRDAVPAASGSDTEYVAAADGAGNFVSFIQSNFMGFGSGVVEPETGIILQNRGHLFSLDEAHPNCIGPRKRCVHTLMPGMILHAGKPYAALGLKGGHVQPQVQAQIISNLIDFHMTPQEAISAPRFNHTDGAKVALEPGFGAPAVEALRRRGHEIVRGAPESFGGAHAVVAHPVSATLIGAADPRKGGCALGY